MIVCLVCECLFIVDAASAFGDVTAIADAHIEAAEHGQVISF